MKNWYRIENKAGVLNISIHDEIGLWGVSAADFIAELDKHPDASAINLSIHSPGGSVLDGLAIYNRLVSHPAKVHATVEGIAASAASMIYMAGDVRAMPEDSFLMIHNAHGVAVGDADAMREMADVVEKLQNSIVNIYERRTGLDRQEIVDMMKDETWMSADEALAKGFADTVIRALGVAAKASNFSRYFSSMPVAADVESIEGIESLKDFERHMRDVYGMSKGLATALASRVRSISLGEPRQKDDHSEEILAALERIKVPDSLAS